MSEIVRLVGVAYLVVVVVPFVLTYLLGRTR